MSYDGPFVIAFVVCSDVHGEDDEPPSPLRIFTAIEAPSFPHRQGQLAVFLMVYAGAVRGKRALRWVIEWPHGQSDQTSEWSQDFDFGSDRAVTARVRWESFDLSFYAFPAPGVYLLKVFSAERELARFPLLVARAPEAGR